VLDRFLDIGAGQFFVQGSRSEGGEFGVGGEAQGDQLRFGKFRDAGTKGGVE